MTKINDSLLSQLSQIQFYFCKIQFKLRHFDFRLYRKGIVQIALIFYWMNMLQMIVFELVDHYYMVRFISISLYLKNYQFLWKFYLIKNSQEVILTLCTKNQTSICNNKDFQFWPKSTTPYYRNWAKFSFISAKFSLSFAILTSACTELIWKRYSSNCPHFLLNEYFTDDSFRVGWLLPRSIGCFSPGWLLGR